MKKKIAIHNFHDLPNIFNLGIHDYIIHLLKNGDVKYLYFDIDKRHLSIDTLRLFRLLFLNCGKINSWGIPWKQIKFIFTMRELNNKCDVLLNFNSHLGKTQFNQRLKRFDGLKIYHVNDYFWNQPGSELNKMLESIGVDYLMGYASHDKHCKYFQKTFKNYIGKVIPVPFGFAERFKVIKPFYERLNKTVALGSVNPLRPLESPIHNYIESANFFPDVSWLHKFRRDIVIDKEKLSEHIDSMLPEFPQIKDFRYDLVKKFNEYQMFVSCESIFNFPPAKYFEGPACGSVLVCADHDCNKEFGFVDGENCIMYKIYDIDNLIEKIKFYTKNTTLLNEIQQNGTKFVRKNYSHQQVALDLIKKLNDLKN
tara:strand:- start:384 stop:1487 length:1104 start_codon:yes stop_codon:yes gene_type:complete